MQKFIPFILQLFAEGDGAGAPGEAAPAAENKGAAAGLPRGRKANPEANTLFGVQPQEAQQVAAANDGASSSQQNTQEEQKKLSFDELLKSDPDYKKDYDAKVQKAVNGRFKGAKVTEERLSQAEGILARLAPRFKVQVDGEIDMAAFAKAVDEDTSYYEARAVANGTSVEIERKLDGYDVMQAQQAQQRAQQERTAQEQQAKERFQAIVQQGEHLKTVYPSFDLEAELQNPQFVRLLHSNVPVKTAYEVMHKDELLASGMQYAVQQTAQKVSSAVQSNAKAPVEGVLGNPTAANHVTDPSKLTKAQREEIRARVRRGDKIVW